MGFFDEKKLVNPRKFSGNMKASIQSNGRLGFSAKAADKLVLDCNKTIIFSELDNGDMAGIVGEGNDERGFRLQKGGNYYYTKMKNFFDSKGINYADKRIIYDISETTETFEEKTVFKFTKREIDKNDEGPDKEESEMEDEE